MTATLEILDCAEALLQLEPLPTYPKRSARIVAKLVGASGHRMELAGESFGEGPETGNCATLAIKNGNDDVGVMRLYRQQTFTDDELHIVRWGLRVLARGIGYSDRLASDERSSTSLDTALEQAPLTPRERDVVRLLVSGYGTRDIASETGLTVSTINTYLKRIFHKMGVHSRVELVARIAGTARPVR